MNKVTNIFLNVDMRNQHSGLAKLAGDYKVDVSKLKAGEHVVFINRYRTMVKMFSRGNIVSYLKSPRPIDIAAIKYFPECFKAGEIDYKKALSKRFEAKFNSKGKRVERF